MPAPVIEPAKIAAVLLTPRVRVAPVTSTGPPPTGKSTKACGTEPFRLPITWLLLSRKVAPGRTVTAATGSTAAALPRLSVPAATV